MTTTRSSRLAAVSTCLALALTACGGDDGETDPTDEPADGPRTVETAGGERLAPDPLQSARTHTR